MLLNHSFVRDALQRIMPPQYVLIVLYVYYCCGFPCCVVTAAINGRPARYRSICANQSISQIDQPNAAAVQLCV